MNTGLAWFNNLKRKIAQFDIKPAKPLIPELLERALIAEKADNYEVYIDSLCKILQIKPTDQQVLLELGETCFSLGKYALAEKYLLRGIRYHPLDSRFFQTLGQVYSYTDRPKDGIKNYKLALELNPNSPSVLHLLNGVQENNSPIAPREYIQNLFDGYADSFDKCLVETLQYRGHVELAEYIASISTTCKLNSRVLDLGCGTGLLGQELIKHFDPQVLDGVDLASNMLEKCQERKIYNSLHKADLLEYLQSCPTTYDIMGCSDVFVYIGNIEPIIAKAQQLLNPHGCLAFTVEKLEHGDYTLKYNGRYKHSLSYITSLSHKNGFNKIYSKAIDLRKEYGNIVAGYLVLLQK